MGKGKDHLRMIVGAIESDKDGVWGKVVAAERQFVTKIVFMFSNGRLCRVAVSQTDPLEDVYEPVKKDGLPGTLQTLVDWIDGDKGELSEMLEPFTGYKYDFVVNLAAGAVKSASVCEAP